jgi:hypothetical protein
LPHQRLETFVKMSADRNAPPKTGWPNMVTELHVADLNVSLAFWKDIIGFEIAYSREGEVRLFGTS